jgi:hypothetical protein
MGDHDRHDDALTSRIVQCQQGCTFATVQPDWRDRSGDGSPDHAPFTCPYDGSHLKLL